MKKIIIREIDILDYRLNRDNLMAFNLNDLINKNPNKKIISLTGNIHNSWNNNYELCT